MCSIPFLETIMETESNTNSQKRMSGSDRGGLTRKKRKSYSAVVEAWLETLSEAIEDDMHKIEQDSTSAFASPQRRTTQRRNAFVLHMTEDSPDQEDDEDALQLQPPPLVWEVIDTLFASETDTLLIEPIIILPNEDLD